MDQKWIHNIEEVYAITDEVFLEEMQQEVYHLFVENYSHLSNKKILWWDEPTFNVKFNAIKNYLFNSNNLMYINHKFETIEDCFNKTKINIKKMHEEFDLIVVPCILFDYEATFIPPTNFSKKHKYLKTKEMVVLTLNMQAIKKVTDITQLKANIITNNFILKLKK